MKLWKNLLVQWKLFIVLLIFAFVPLLIMLLSASYLASVAAQYRLLLMIGGGVVLVLLAYGIAGIATHPLRVIARVADKIVKGESVERLPVADSRDEIAVVTQAFRAAGEYSREMTHIATRIAQGDLSGSFAVRSEGDNLGLALQQMFVYLKRMSAVVTAISEGDLRHEAQDEMRHDALSKALQQVQSLRALIREIITDTERIGDASAILKQISADMAAGAEEVSRQAHVVSTNSQQINHNMSSVSTATEEFAASIREISRMTHDVSEIATSAIEVTNTASMTIFSLKSDTEAISDIVKLINTIAQQTNLLALNATIEAARAGETGRGFAVVAGEVKELSRATTKSLEDITHKVEAIQVSSKDVTAAVVQLSDIIHRVHELAVAIASSIEQQTATTREIAKNIGETAHGSDEITNTMTEVAAATEQVSNQTAHVQDAAEELAELSEQLRHVVKKFKV